jgi:hypothetical protein
MAAPAAVLNLHRTMDCTFITTHFSMGIGRMRQIKQLEVTTTADKSQLRHQKQLIDSPELDEIRSQDAKLKRFLESKTCSYDEATRFVPKFFLPEIDKVMEAYRVLRRPALVAKFMEVYQGLEALDFEPLREALGDQFERSDYPTAEMVERGFRFSFYYRPVGEIALQGISPVIIAREIEKENSIRIQAVTEWRDAMRTMGMSAVDALADVLTPENGKRKKLYETHVTKLQEFLETYDFRDLAGDTEYQQYVKQLRGIMQGVTIDRLRENESLKIYVAEKLDAVKKGMGGLVQVSGRKFR